MRIEPDADLPRAQASRPGRLLPRFALIVGTAVPVLYVAGLALSHLLQRDLREALGFVFCAAASVFVAGILAARLWLQWVTLGRNDLFIID